MGQMLENTRLLKRDRRPTVGCPVVVSLLPREWSCLYRRYFPQKCFSVPERNLVKIYQLTVCLPLTTPSPFQNMYLY